MRKLIPASQVSANILSKNISPPNNTPSKNVNLFPEIEIKIFEEGFRSDGDEKKNTIEGFIALVKQFENKIKFEGDTKNCFTQLRKLYYDDDVFNKTLIPETGGITINEKVDSGLRKQLRSLKTIVAKDNILIDMGHVLCGIDGYNHKGKVGGVRLGFILKAQHNYDLVTWLGDLGSIVSGFYIESKDHDWRYPPTKNEIESWWRSSIRHNCSPEDMTGDIDGLLIATKYECGKEKKGDKPSKILSDYYIDNLSLTPIKTRTENFADFIELGKEIQNSSNWIRDYTEDMQDSIIMNKLKYSTINVATDLYFDTELSTKKCAEYILISFVKSLINSL